MLTRTTVIVAAVEMDDSERQSSQILRFVVSLLLSKLSFQTGAEWSDHYSRASNELHPRDQEHKGV